MSETLDGKTVVQVPRRMVDNVRELLADDAMSNDVRDGREFSDEFLAKHLVAVIHDFNAAPPRLDLTLTFAELFTPDYAAWRPQIEQAAVARALRFGAIRGVRNQMSYTAGSVSFDPNANAPAQLALATQLWAEWERWRDAEKIQLNVSGGWSVAHSDFLVRELHQHGGVITVTGGPI